MADYFSENMNIISQLADKPNLNAAAMKTKFDEAGNKIKTFINGTIATDIDGLKAGTALTAGAIKTVKIDDGAVTTDKLADGNVTSAKLAPQTKLVLSGTNIYGDNLPGSGVTGQIFFKKVT